MGLSIYSVELRTKKSYSTEYILSFFGGGDWRIFSVEDVLNVPYSVGGGRARDFFLGYEKKHSRPTFILFGRYGAVALDY